MFHREFEIVSTQVNLAWDLRLASLMQILQDVALAGADDLGVGSDVAYLKGYLWVISRMDIDIIRVPKYREKIDVYTYPGKTLGFFYPRHFFIKDKNGEVIIRASSVWALIRREDRKIEMKNVFPELVGESLEGELPRPRRLTPMPKENILEERIVRYSDVDLNAHLNNTRYVEMIDDLISGKEHMERILTHVTLNYEREVKEGETITFVGQTGLKTEVTGYIGELPAFEAEVQYK